MQRSFLNLALLSVLLIPMITGCQGSPPIIKATLTYTSLPPTPSTTPTPSITRTPTPFPPIPIAINTSIVKQTLREVGGGNFIQRFAGIENALDPVSLFNLSVLNPKIIRVSIDLDQWEPTPGAPTSTRFKDEGKTHSTFEFLQQVKGSIQGVTLIGSIWEVPDWMVSNPDAEDNRIIPPENYLAVIDSITDWLVVARDRYGVEVDYISFNEANGGVNIKFTSAEEAALIGKAGPILQDKGLKTRFLLGDTSSIASASSFIPPIYDVAAIRPYLGPLSIHSWDYQTSDQLLQAVGDYAAKNGLEVWCTEAGWDPDEWNRPEEFSSWTHALNLANIYIRVLRDTRATSMLYWEMLGNDYPLNDGQQAYPALLYLSELQRYFPPGSKIVQTPPDPILNISLLVLAARTPGDGVTVQILNQINLERRIKLSGLPEGEYALDRLSAAGGREELSPLQLPQDSVLTLPPQSISFFILQK